MADDGSQFFYNFDLGEAAFEFHAIKVKSLPENRQFDTIKLFTDSRELIYLRPQAFSIPGNEDHHLLLRGPKVPVFSEYDEAGIVIGDERWNWNTCFHGYRYPKFGIQSVVVEDPQFPEAAVEIVFERIRKPAQAHFRFIFKDDSNKDSKIYITRGEIWATSHGDDHRTKRLLRCFGDDLTKHMEPSSSEIPESKKMRPEPTKMLLVSEEAIDLYKSHFIIPASESEDDKISNLFIHFNLELEFEGVGSLPFKETASITAPTDPRWLGNRDFILSAMEFTKETFALKIDDCAKIQLEISWFNDVSGHIGTTLWGYGDGDCDYKGYKWADRQEIDWNDPIQVEKKLSLI